MRNLFLLFVWVAGAQHNQKIDFLSAKANLVLNDKNKSVSGTVIYKVNVFAPIDTLRIDAKKMEFTAVFVNQQQVSFKNSGKQLLLFEGFKKGKNTISVQYSTIPPQTLYFIGSKANHNLQIWTQGQGKYTSFWFPSFDDVNEKMVFETTVVFDADYQVIANGTLQSMTKIDTVNARWHYKMQKPMSSYLLMLAVGKFDKRVEKSKSGIVLENYIQPKDTAKYRTTFKDSKQIFDFLEAQIGVRYPWQVYRQVPIEDFLYAGMENTTATLFSQDFVVDNAGFNDLNYINVNAHELAHHWFGNLVTAKSGKHHWLQEGFATFYALLAEKKLFGDDYFYYQMFRNAQQVRQAAKNDTVPIGSEKASSLSFYQKGSLALFIIYDQIGEKKFKKVVRNYLNKYQFKTVETEDFLNEVKKITNFDTEKFKLNWLESAKFMVEEMNTTLLKSDFIKKISAIQSRKNKPFTENEGYFSTILSSDGNYLLKAEIIYQIKNVPFEAKEKLLNLALQCNDLAVRQAVAVTVEKIPLLFKTAYESLLNDNSYVTKEIALIRLCNQFPDSDADYLQKAQSWIGNNDLNLRITYLFLSQFSATFDADQKQKNAQELIQYTHFSFESSVRKNAFDAALQLTPIDDKVLENLVNATTHFKWQFNKFARDYVRNLLKTPFFRARFEVLKTSFERGNANQIQKFLDEKPK